jgi:hypothetical protein
MHDAILNTALVRALHSTTRSVSVRRGGGGQPQPQVSIECAPDAPEHRARAAVFAVAALVSFAAAQGNVWTVRADVHGRRVYLDLPRDASGDQIAHALRLLERIAA